MHEERILRELLVGIERDPAISQRKLSEDLGVSVGSINWYIKRCVKKGLVKLGQAPVKRYLYYLTPEGFAEKTRLTASYLSISFDIFRAGRQQYEALFNLCEANGWTNIMLLGESELTELALLVLSRYENITAHCIFDIDSTKTTIAGLPVFSTLKDVQQCLPSGGLDALIGAGLDIKLPEKHDADAFLAEFNIDRSRLLVPAFIGSGMG